MNACLKRMYVAFSALAVCLMSPSTHAHLMVAQHGTLNIVGHDVFMVLSLPISAFDDIDEDNNGEVSMIEFNRNRAAIAESVRRNVVLSDANGDCPLHGLTLSPVLSDHATHHASSETMSQLVVMGRFALDDSDHALRFEVGLYGTLAAERSLQVTVTRRAPEHRQVFELTPAKPAGQFFSEPLAALKTGGSH